jgi:biopolymer transport protein ExbB/TolQ
MDYSLSPVAMFLNAGLIAKIVMAALVGASVWTWIVAIDGVYVLLRISRALRAARADGSVGVLWPIAAQRRQAINVVLPGETAKQRQARILGTAERAASEFMSSARRGLPSLAIVASVGPFVGLFGTVWGIMSSFSNIAHTQETGLTVVAPGIAEALAATAYGLAAAIPAAIGYNRIGSAFAEIGNQVMDYARAGAVLVRASGDGAVVNSERGVAP